MSLFDVIKYPITSDFNQEDLACLPDDLFMGWLSDMLQTVGLRPTKTIMGSRKEAATFVFVYGQVKKGIDVDVLQEYMYLSLKRAIAEYAVDS